MKSTLCLPKVVLVAGLVISVAFSAKAMNERGLSRLPAKTDLKVTLEQALKKAGQHVKDTRDVSQMYLYSAELKPKKGGWVWEIWWTANSGEYADGSITVHINPNTGETSSVDSTPRPIHNTGRTKR